MREISQMLGCKRLIAAAVITSAIVVAFLARFDTSQATQWWQWNESRPLHEREWKHWLERLNNLSAAGVDSRKLAVKQQSGTVEVVTPLPNRPESFDSEVSVSWINGTNAGGCSLVLDVGFDARYAFTVMPDGQVAVALITHDATGAATHEALSGPRFIPAALQSREDTLTVRVRGQKLAFLLNNKQIAEIADTMMQSDWTLSVFAQGHQNIVLDNLFVKSH